MFSVISSHFALTFCNYCFSYISGQRDGRKIQLMSSSQASTQYDRTYDSLSFGYDENPDCLYAKYHNESHQLTQEEVDRYYRRYSHALPRYIYPSVYETYDCPRNSFPYGRRPPQSNTDQISDHIQDVLERK